MGKQSFLDRLKNMWKHISNKASTLILFSIIAVNYLVILIFDDTLTTYAKRFLLWLFPKIRIFLSSFFFAKPYLFEFTVFLIFIMVIVIIAYFETKPPRNFFIEVDDKPNVDSVVGVRIGNYSKNDWIHCKILLEKLTTNISDIPDDVDYKYLLPQEMLWQTRNELRNFSPDIEINRDPVRLAIAFKNTNEDEVGSFASVEGVPIYKGSYEAHFYFTAETRTGLDISHYFLVQLKSDGKLIELLKIKKVRNI